MSRLLARFEIIWSSDALICAPKPVHHHLKNGQLGGLCIDRVKGDEGVIGGEAGVGNDEKVNVRLEIGEVAKLVVRREASSKAEHFKNML